MKKKVLITGISGQDGSYLSEFLLNKDYEVHGITNPKNKGKYPPYIDQEKIKFHNIDILSKDEVSSIINFIKPDEIYHLASDVEPRVIQYQELKIFNLNFIPGINILDAIINNNLKTKIYIAGSSLMFGDTEMQIQDEKTPMQPNTPYGIAKTSLYKFICMYRKVYGLYCVCGILYNHESIRRDSRFLPRKITEAAANIKLGIQEKLELGNIELERDWSYAGDIVRSMWLMMQNKYPKDYVVGSGKLTSIKEILEIAFSHVGLNWKDHVIINQNLYRKVEFNKLCANPELIKRQLGWETSISFRDLIIEMTDNDLEKGKNAN
jgi:GDPmannose 4,6-dehydratase